MGHLKINHMRDVVNVDTTGGKVAGHKNADFAGAEAFESPLAGTLGFVAVNGGCADAVFIQPILKFIGVVFGAHKYQSAGDIIIFDNVENEVFLVVFSDVIKSLRDQFACA